MRNDLYWQDRFVQLKESLIDKGIDYYKNISEQYDKAAASVQKEIDVFYQRFAKNNELDLIEAKKLLNAKELKEFKWDVKEYIEKGKTLNYTDEWAKELENASLRYRISRLEAMQLQMQQQVESVMGHEVDELDNMTRQIYEDGYYHSIFELQKGRGVGSSFAILDTDKINKVISKPWASDGTNFSERVWGQHRPALIQSLNTDLVQALIRGDNPQDLTNKISKEFEVAKYKANRLLYTEAAFFSEAGQKDAFNELGVKYFSICAALDNDTCEDCGDREGEKIPMSMYEVGVTAPPFHPNCRCTTLPEDEIESDNTSYRMARDENGKNYEVPSNMTYRQWKTNYIDDKFDDNSDKKEIEKKVVPEVKLEKLKKKLSPDEYQEYVDLIKRNDDLANLYSKYGDAIYEIKKTSGRGCYRPAYKSINFSILHGAHCKKGGSPFSTLAHEYGHAFDYLGKYKDLHFEEISVLDKYCEFRFGDKDMAVFKSMPSTSDEFLSALRKDKELLSDIYMGDGRKELFDDLLSTTASSSVQDVVGGFFGSYGLIHIHADSYYDTIYNNYIKPFNDEENMKKAFAELGITLTSKAKVRNALRIYTISCEAWADITCAATCGGKSLDYVKKYLPNSYKAFTSIIKKVV